MSAHSLILFVVTLLLYSMPDYYLPFCRSPTLEDGDSQALRRDAHHHSTEAHVHATETVTEISISDDDREPTVPGDHLAAKAINHDHRGDIAPGDEEEARTYWPASEKLSMGKKTS